MAVEYPRNAMARQASRESTDGSMNSYSSEGKSVSNFPSDSLILIKFKCSNIRPIILAYSNVLPFTGIIVHMIHVDSVIRLSFFELSKFD